MTDWLWILAGLAMLLIAADLLVRGSAWLAMAAGISPMMVGLTLVAFGTSAPELVVSLTAALDDAPGIATGSVLGSNVANIALIIGLAAVITPIDHTPRSAKFECRFLIVLSALLLVPLLTGRDVARVEGIVLLGALACFVTLLVARERRARRSRRTVDAEDPAPVTDRSPGKVLAHIVFALAGLVGLKYGGEFLVDGATGLARSLGMTEAVIGLTIVAVGTSLPELATSAVAARKGHSEIALGNVLGSNVFNLGMVLGAAGVVTPLPLTWASEGTSIVLGLALAVLLSVFLRRGGVSRTAGIALLATDAAYVTWTVVQQH